MIAPAFLEGLCVLWSGLVDEARVIRVVGLLATLAAVPSSTRVVSIAFALGFTVLASRGSCTPPRFPPQWIPPSGADSHTTNKIFSSLYCSIWGTNEHELYDMTSHQYQMSSILPNTISIQDVSSSQRFINCSTKQTHHAVLSLSKLEPPP